MPARYRRPIQRSPKSDPQRNRLYRMEDENIAATGYSTMTRKMVEKMARTVCRNFKVPHVVIRYKDLGEWAAEWSEPNFITFGPAWLSPVTVAHELAHHIHYSYAPDATHQLHGKEFMCVYMAVLDQCRIIPAISFRPLCDQYKVKYIDPGDLSRPLSAPRLKALIAQP